jgi:hypothetical protein
MSESSNEPDAHITVLGQDGRRFDYFAYSGPDYSPGETGWVLVLTGTPEPVAPQAVSAMHVVGDFESMDINVGRDTVGFFTKQMIAALEAGQVAPQRHDGEPDAETRRAQLKRELAAVRDPRSRCTLPNPSGAARCEGGVEHEA